MKVLVADDDPTSLLIATSALLALGHRCHTVPDGEQAWDEFLAWEPDTVISDLLMPGLTGFQLCSAIRAHQTHGYPYFIMVTGQGACDEILEGMNVGADDYLVKPLDVNDLRARLVAAARVTSLYRRLDHEQTELQELNDELTDIARRDPLTDVGNRRALDEDLELFEARVNRYGHRYCVALIDVDHFKSYNDSYGHQAGDEVLALVARELKTQARAGDVLYRYGGDEFLCIFPEQSLASGTLAVDRMRTGLEKLDIPHAGNTGGVLTFSAGLAVLESGRARTAGQVLKEADQALYRAKRTGRNRVERAVAEAL
jgi:two-component system chemotaxis response regulator CheY